MLVAAYHGLRDDQGYNSLLLLSTVGVQTADCLVRKRTGSKIQSIVSNDCIAFLASEEQESPKLETIYNVCFPPPLIITHGLDVSFSDRNPSY